MSRIRGPGKEVTYGLALSPLLQSRYQDGEQALFTEMATRFLIGGVIVSAFAVLGSVFKPRTFAGLFGAAPSVAIATVILTLAKKGPAYAAVEARSMLAGALALCCYCIFVAFLLERRKLPALRSTIFSMVVWFGVAFGLWSAFLN